MDQLRAVGDICDAFNHPLETNADEGYDSDKEREASEYIDAQQKRVLANQQDDEEFKSDLLLCDDTNGLNIRADSFERAGGGRTDDSGVSSSKVDELHKAYKDNLIPGVGVDAKQVNEKIVNL